MAEDQEIKAALTKPWAQDAGAADDAQAALEWIAGELGLRLVTQERTRTFCCYDLPVKWLTSLDDKVRVTGALARALDLLGLPPVRPGRGRDRGRLRALERRRQCADPRGGL
jgi:hypothetical protein